MPKTIIVSNRLPIEFKITNTAIEAKPSIGGLATGLKSVHANGNSLWVGWSGVTEEQVAAANQHGIGTMALEQRCIAVALNEREVDDFYLGFSNRSLWPLFHYFMAFTEYQPAQWLAYQDVNAKFADAVLEHAEEGDHIWVHDYQLLLLPKMLRDRNPKLSIGFFLHIPFPAFEIFRTCPWRTELLEGMLGADLIGFHTYGYVQNFLNSVKNIIGLPVKFNEIQIDARTAKADSFPMGIDYNAFNEAAHEHRRRKPEENSPLANRLAEHITNYPESKLILSIDRLDYTKGIPHRINAFAHFLEKYPQFIEKVRLVMLAVPSRINVPQYGKLKKETDELVGRINGKFGTIDWTPIWYFYRSMPFEDLVALYASSQVALITPLRDGMNLVAKEYIASRIDGDGILILSELAGAASEMHEALLINPHHVDQFADALKAALEMPATEQQSRINALQKRLRRYNVEKWADDFMKALTSKNQLVVAPVCKKMSKVVTQNVLSDYHRAHHKLMLLDYDGTLVDFCANPEDACPGDSLYALLDELSHDESTHVAIISGRGRDSIERWFGNKNYTLITDHGIWMRRGHSAWEQLEDASTDWKAIVRPIMESFVDRTPGTFLEDKQYSIAWHYRKADADMAEIRTRELKMLLTNLVTENGLSVLEGDKVLEVKNSNVTKGRAASRLIAMLQPDFIFAAGDDLTDEFMFEALPESAHTVKIGLADTKAKYYCANRKELIALLEDFATTSIH